MVAVPVMGSLLVVGPFVLPEHRGPAYRVDLMSVTLVLVATVLTVYGIKHLDVVPALAGMAVAVVLVRRQGKVERPLVGILVVYLGQGPVMALSTDPVVGAAPQDKAGAAVISLLIAAVARLP